MNMRVIPVFKLKLLLKTHKSLSLISFIFKRFWHTLCQIIGRPTLVWGTPLNLRRLGNPGSATENSKSAMVASKIKFHTALTY